MAGFVHKGTAVLRLPNGGQWRVFANAVAFESVGGDDRLMGPEALYEATYQINDKPNAPGGKWTVSEYPIGALNYVSFEPLNGATLVSDFDFEIVHEQE